jgi:hypothetical protein
MKPWSTLIFPSALVVLGVVPVLCFAALAAWQSIMLFQAGKWVPLPSMGLLPEGVLPAHPAALWMAVALPAAAGLAIAALGMLGIRRQRAAIRAHRQQSLDRQRRVEDYRREDAAADRLDGRREPFIADFR